MANYRYRENQYGKTKPQFQCPNCDQWYWIDNLQFTGQKAIECINSDFNEEYNVEQDGTLVDEE